jgi:hypothetical protein
MNTRPQNTSPRPTEERPQAGLSQRGEAPRRAADPQRMPAAVQSRSDARHATRVVADSEVLIVGV